MLISEFYAPDAPDIIDTGPIYAPGARFTVTPLSQTTTRGLPTGPYTVTLTDGAGNPLAQALDQQFILSDGGNHGLFSGGGNPLSDPLPAPMDDAPDSDEEPEPTGSPTIIVTIPAGSTSATFTYTNSIAGTYLLGVAPSGGPLGTLLPLTVTAVVTQPGVNAGIGGYDMPAASINSPGKIFDVGYLYGSLAGLDDTPFATCHKISIKDTTAFKKLLGPEQLTALAVGASERTITIEAEWATFKLENFLLAKGGSISTITSLVAPTTAPTLTAAAGTTTYTAGYIAVAYSWVTPYGQTAISTIATVQVTSGQQITVTDLGTAMGTAGATAINYFMSAMSYATAAAASAAPLYLCMSNTGGATILPTNYPPLTNQSTPIISPTGATRRIQTFGVNDQPVPCRFHYLTPRGGGDLEYYFYNCMIPDITIDHTMKDFVVPKLTIDCYGDNTQSGRPIWSILSPSTTGI